MIDPAETLSYSLCELTERIGGYNAAWRRHAVDLIRAAYAEQTAELERFRRGDLTPAEFQELCHNLHEKPKPCTPQEHCDGCEAFQVKMFGASPITELKQQLAERGAAIRMLREVAGQLSCLCGPDYTCDRCAARVATEKYVGEPKP